MLQNKGMLTSEYNWEAVKEFYLKTEWLSGVTFKTLANAFNIPYQSVRRRAAKERWRLIREWKSVDDGCKTVDEYIYYYKC